MNYSNADVRKVIASLPRIRSLGVPFESRAGCIVLFADAEEMKRDGARVRDRFRVPPLFTALDLSRDFRSLSDVLGTEVVQLEQIRRRVDRELVINIGRSTPPRKKLHLTRVARGRGREVFFYSDRVVRNATCRPGFFANNAER